MKIIRSFPAIIAALLIAALPLPSPAQFSVGVGFTVGQAPPPLPIVSQPPAPYPNWQWTPGYWAWGQAGYYWVPGTWVAPPAIGMYWTPGYWGASGVGVGIGFGWNTGYWGPTVGFYGGINYGFGYPGTGFYGGSWNNGAFAYNTAVTRVNTTNIHNTYNKTVINKNVCNNCKNVSFNGGKGGTTARPTQDQITSRKNGKAPTTAQKDQATFAGKDRNQLASVNNGRPSLTSSDRPFNTNNKPQNSAPVTTADKQAAGKIPTHSNNNPSNQALGNKAPTTQNKPANTMQNKPANTMQNKPANTMQHQGHHNAMGTQGQHNQQMGQPHHKQPPSTMHQGGGMGQGHPGGGQGHPGGQHPQGQGKPPGGGTGGKPPRRH